MPWHTAGINGSSAVACLTAVQVLGGRQHSTIDTSTATVRDNLPPTAAHWLRITQRACNQGVHATYQPPLNHAPARNARMHARKNKHSHVMQTQPYTPTRAQEAIPRPLPALSQELEPRTTWRLEH